jgi:hypothetical protein
VLPNRLAVSPSDSKTLTLPILSKRAVFHE